MPIRIVLGEREALALDGVADDRRRRCRVERQPCARALRSAVDIVAVDLGDGEAEAAPFVGKRLELLDVRGRASRLDLVVVDHGGEIVEPVLAGAHRGFPDRAFVDLAVAHDHEDAVVALLRIRAASAMPTPIDKSMSERAGRGFDARHLAVFRMAAENAVARQKRLEILDVGK